MATPTAHAKLSPSSSHRWLHCTPSAVLESYEPSKTSVYAEEGTHAHELAELKLALYLGQITAEQYETKFTHFKSESKWYNEEMEENINEYVAKVLDIAHHYNDKDGQECKVYLEEYVKFDDIVQDGSGTSDVVIIAKDTVHIVDLKYGRGVEVSANENSQLMLYALGALKAHMREVVAKEVKMTIIQPRLFHSSTYSISVEELNKWALEFVKPRAEMAHKGIGSLESGEWCRFCKRRGKCEQLAEDQLKAAQAEFDEIVVEQNIIQPKDLAPEVISRIMNIAPRFIDWFNDIKEYATNAMLFGQLDIPGYKVVEGRSNRKIFDPEGVKTALQNAGYTEEDYLKPQELVGITELEKRVGKKLFTKLCGQFIEKPPGKATLVSEDDKREALVLKSLDGSEFAIFENEEE